MNDPRKKPDWLRRRFSSPGSGAAVRHALRQLDLHTVCVEAKCPNRSQCFSRGTATFLLLGPNCTRRCRFCAVNKLPVRAPDFHEPLRIAEAAAQMGLDYVVITMVSRDDLPDGGARHVARTVYSIRDRCPSAEVELLISDLGGSWDGLEAILSSGPEVLNHNIETCSRMYSQIRPQADYKRSLRLLKRAASHNPSVITKSGVMLGLGETREDVLETMDHLREAQCQILTLGQYLAPSDLHHPVARYVSPEEFEEFENDAFARGFICVASAPLVRSSFMAKALYQTALDRVLHH